jgi:hypothetical protein
MELMCKVVSCAKRALSRSGSRRRRGILFTVTTRNDLYLRMKYDCHETSSKSAFRSGNDTPHLLLIDDYVVL